MQTILCFNSAASFNSKMVKTADASAAAAAETKYKGVRKRKWGKYVCEVRLPNSRERIWLGSYDTAEKAARAFDAALFCLRGPTAKFNFPDDPPNIAGCQALSPADIQAVAHHYANTYCGAAPTAEVGALDASPPSESGSMDWSFLDALDLETGNAGRVWDFGFFHEPVDMYVQQQQHLNEDDDSGNGGNVPSFLWNF